MSRLKHSRLYLVAAIWATFVFVTGFYADTFGLTSAVMSAIALLCLAVSIRGWKHILALPLYVFFASELLVFLALLARR